MSAKQARPAPAQEAPAAESRTIQERSGWAGLEIRHLRALVALARGVQIFFAVEGNRDWMVPGIKRERMSQEVESANAESFHVGAGALFEF